MGQVRNIKAEVERLLWGIAAGRCEFEGCNKVLYRHEVTGDSGNYAEKAHVYAVNPGGARFCPDTEDFKNSVENLMLACPQCHVMIDRNELKYTPEVLFEMKRKHEQRIFTLTSISPELKSHIVYYTANIAGTNVSINDGDARNALVSYGRYPAENLPIDLGQRGSLTTDHEDAFFSTNTENLCRAVKSRVLDVIEDGESVALFALAPQPLLMYLGNLLNDKYNVSVFQCHRREYDKWSWSKSAEQVQFHCTYPKENALESKVALVFSLSSNIVLSRIYSALGSNVLVYSITVAEPSRDFVTNPNILDDFVAKSRTVMEEIKQRHGKAININVFPAMPASLAVRFGMDYMSKTDNPLVIYDEQPEEGFIKALTLGGGNNEQ
jgi:hypothetical protein